VYAIDAYNDPRFGLPTNISQQDHPTNFGVMYGIALYSQGAVAPALELPDYSCILYGRELR